MPAKSYQKQHGMLSTLHRAITEHRIVEVQHGDTGRSVERNLIGVPDYALPFPGARYRADYDIIPKGVGAVMITRDSSTVLHEAPKVDGQHVCSHEEQTIQRGKIVPRNGELDDCSYLTYNVSMDRDKT